MPATPVTSEARAVAERLRAFQNLEGNVAYLQKIGEDSAAVADLAGELGAVSPPVDQSLTDGLTAAVSVCESVSACSGNITVWPLVTVAADNIDAACDAVEAGNAEPEADTKPAPKAP
jgi:hypothetical protein